MRTQAAIPAWSARVDIEYAQYRGGRFSAEVELDGSTERLQGNESGFVVLTDPETTSVTLEVWLTSEAPAPGTTTVTVLSRDGEEEQVGITTWDRSETVPASYDLIGPGRWQVWLEHDAPYAPDSEDPDEVVENHRLYFQPLDDTARRWYETGTQELAERRQRYEAGRRNLPDYSKFVRPKAGVYLLSWDLPVLEAALPDIDLANDVGMRTVVDLPGAVAFRQAPKAEWQVNGRIDAEPARYSGLEVIRRVEIPGPVPLHLLDSALRPLGRIPDPAGIGPCVVDMVLPHDGPHAPSYVEALASGARSIHDDWTITIRQQSTIHRTSPGH